MNFAPGPMWAFGWVTAVLTIFGAAILLLFVRSLLVGDPGLQAADVAVALGAAIAIPLLGMLTSWLAMRRFRAMTMHTAEFTSEPSAVSSGPMDRFDKFDVSARRALTLAQDEASQLQYHYIGTEHILLGLIREREGLASRALTRLGVDLEKVRTAVTFIIGQGRGAIGGEVGLTPRGKRVIELAIEESRQLGSDHIGTGHLLLGLVREGEGIAAAVLQSLGVTIERAREAVVQEMSDNQR